MLILIGVNQVIVGGGASRETEVSSGARAAGRGRWRLLDIHILHPEGACAED